MHRTWYERESFASCSNLNCVQAHLLFAHSDFLQQVVPNSSALRFVMETPCEGSFSLHGELLPGLSLACHLHWRVSLLRSLSKLSATQPQAFPRHALHGLIYCNEANLRTKLREMRTEAILGHRTPFTPESCEGRNLGLGSSAKRTPEWNLQPAHKANKQTSQWARSRHPTMSWNCVKLCLCIEGLATRCFVDSNAAARSTWARKYSIDLRLRVSDFAIVTCFVLSAKAQSSSAQAVEELLSKMQTTDAAAKKADPG